MGEVAVRVRVKPGSRRPGVGGRWESARGPALVVAVTAPAADGKANAAVLAALAVAFGVPARDVGLRRGQRSRDKLVVLHGPADVLRARLVELLDQSHHH